MSPVDIRNKIQRADVLDILLTLILFVLSLSIMLLVLLLRSTY